MTEVQGTLTSNTSTAAFRAGPRRSPGAKFTVFASGTFDGGTLKLEVSPDGNTWFDVTGASLTAKGYIEADLNGELFRLTLSGATSPSVNYWVV